MHDTLDRSQPFAITCRKCRSTDLKALRHWHTPPTGKGFEPTHHCNACGLDFIYRSPKETLRSFMLD